MQLKAGDISNNNPITLEANKTLYDARNILIKYNISRVAIIKEREIKEQQELLQKKILLAFFLETYLGDILMK